MLDIKKGKKEISLNKLKKFEKEIEKILSKLIKFLCLHIENQFNAGADVIQIFDSWAGLIPSKNIREYCYEPNAKIVNFCKKNNIPNICFPRGIKEKFKNFNKIVKPDGINIDYEIKPEWVLKNLKNVVIQGGLNPKMLLENEAKMIKGATKYIKTFKGIPYIFNLGHGLLPETDPDKVKKLIELYRKY